MTQKQAHDIIKNEFDNFFLGHTGEHFPELKQALEIALKLLSRKRKRKQ